MIQYLFVLLRLGFEEDNDGGEAVITDEDDDCGDTGWVLGLAPVSDAGLNP